MNRLLLLPLTAFLWTLSHHTATAQAAHVVPDTAQRTEVIYRPMRWGGHIEQMPVFEGGYDNLFCFLYQNNKFGHALTGYPAGKVFVEFVIDTIGHVQQPQVIKTLHPALDAEAVRLVRLMSGRFSPGRQSGRAVAVAYSLPIAFPAVAPSGRWQLKRCASSFKTNTR
ncbi:energy transducer TonB [Hymenobacter rigui]|uniref:Energy transducer TonB n=1 Tax=Hymenobacter rigui TaxID=334424 RepID=A0A3R9P828_9BACT|nr:energy transducer TonB [Hymenobacter rigui]RSK50819.1 energy transducer TonB [Hymenobacter rigui]